MKKIVVLVGMVFLMFIIINANCVFAEPPHQEIIERLDAIQNTLDSDVVPYLTGMGVPRTGQTTSYESGDDGDLERGIPWPIPRFTDNGDGTVTDNFTRLIWLKNANCFGQEYWATALIDCNTLNSGECGLSDGSSEGDWRLPNVRELQSLIDYGNYLPALPSGHPFTGVQSDYYWSSTTNQNHADNARCVGISFGNVPSDTKATPRYVWPVRGGN